MNFGQALEELKKGEKVARKGWNGKGMWLKFVAYLPDNVETIPNDYTCLPWIGMKTADNKFVPWLASQTDVLAEDWEVVE